MYVRGSDRLAPSAGGLVVDSGSPAVRDVTEALLVCADGSTWRGWRACSSAAAAGEVRLVGDEALVGEDGRLSGIDPASLGAHLASARAAGHAAGVRGCVTAAGATTPLHAQVALAVARGEIGRPR